MTMHNLGTKNQLTLMLEKWKGQEIQRRLFLYHRRGLRVLLIIHYNVNLPVEKYNKNILFKLVLA